MVVTGLVGGWGRYRLRGRYHITGGFAGDFLCHCFCHCCSLAKEAREIRAQAIQQVLSEDIDLSSIDLPEIA